MITNDDIKKIFEDSLLNKKEVRVRDIAYVLLCRYIDDKSMVYKCLFGEDSEKIIRSYSSSSVISYLSEYIEDNFFSSEDITFEENKAYMLKLKRRTEDAVRDKKMSEKDALTILTKISVTLNDKFSVNDDAKDNVVIVEQKFNDICPYCRHEIAAKEVVRDMTKKEAMEKYNLIEKI